MSYRGGAAATRARVSLAGSAAVLLWLSGCSTVSETAASPASTSTATITTGTVTTGDAATITSTVAGATIVAVAPPSTSEPAAVDGTCPYLSDDDVADINGQHTGTTQLIDVSPYPICVFYRSDGGFMASVRIIQADTPQAAVAAVNAHVPIEGSNPASQPPGWTGGSMVTDSGSIYAVSKGTVALVAESNQQQSIKGRQLVVSTINALGL
ncbi:MAG: DUF2020 domain-containing protein [Nakamurella sp.]